MTSTNRLVVDADPEVDSDPGFSGPARSYDESHQLTKALFADEYRLDRRDGWWRYRHLRSWKLTAGVVAVCERHETTPARVYQFIVLVADRCNKSGSDVLYLKRETIAAGMFCSVRTVARCRAAAIELGYHSPTIQQRWIDDEHGRDPWKASSAMFVLTMPDTAVLGTTREAEQAKARIGHRLAVQRQQRLAEKQAREQKRQAEMDELLARQPDPVPAPAPRRRTVPDSVARAKERLAKRPDTS